MSASGDSGNGNSRQQIYYLGKEARRLSDCFDHLKQDVGQIKVDIAALKVKASVWGIVGGTVPVIITLGIALAVYILKGG